MIRTIYANAIFVVFATTLVAAPEPELPAGAAESEFREFLTNSPFTRSLNLSSTLVLTGIATIDGESIATIVDTASKESYVVSADSNSQGWRMVEIEGDRSDLETVTARISVSGGEVIAVRFDDVRLKPGESKPANARGGEGARPDRGDGERRPEGGKGGKGMKGKGKGKGDRGGGGEGREGTGGKGGLRGGAKGGERSGATGEQGGGGGGRSASS